MDHSHGKRPASAGFGAYLSVFAALGLVSLCLAIWHVVARQVPAQWWIIATLGRLRRLGCTFPGAFVDPPWVTACVVNTIPPFTAVKIQACISSAAAVELYWNSAPVNLTYVAISWMAIGPIGV